MFSTIDTKLCKKMLSKLKYFYDTLTRMHGSLSSVINIRLELQSLRHICTLILLKTKFFDKELKMGTFFSK